MAVMSSHPATPTEASRPAFGNGNVNLIHGHSSAAARPEDRHAGRPIPWEEPLLLTPCLGGSEGGGKHLGLPS